MNGIIIFRAANGWLGQDTELYHLQWKMLELEEPPYFLFLGGQMIYMMWNYNICIMKS